MSKKYYVNMITTLKLKCILLFILSFTCFSVNAIAATETELKDIKEKQYIKHIPPIYETEFEVKNKAWYNYLEKNNYEVLHNNIITSVLGDDAYIIYSDKRKVKINNFHNPDAKINMKLCDMVVKKNGNVHTMRENYMGNGNFSSTTALDEYMANYIFNRCKEDVYAKFESTFKPNKPQLIKKAEYYKATAKCKYNSILDDYIECDMGDGRWDIARVVDDVDNLFCNYSGKKEKCRTLKDVCKQYHDLCIYSDIMGMAALKPDKNGNCVFGYKEDAIGECVVQEKDKNGNIVGERKPLFLCYERNKDGECISEYKNFFCMMNNYNSLYRDNYYDNIEEDIDRGSCYKK